MSKVYVMGVYTLGSEYRLVVRDGADFNRFCLISMGTGESNGPMHPARLKAYLAGDNPHQTPFEYVGNLRDVWKGLHPDFNPCANIIVPDDVPTFSDEPVVGDTSDQYDIISAEDQEKDLRRDG